MSTLVIGVDPGVTTGIVAFGIGYGPEPMKPRALQCSHGWAELQVHQLLHLADTDGSWVLLAVERFVVGPRAARSSTPQAGQITRELVARLIALAERYDVRVVARPAADVKPWATDRRLEAAGLLEPCKGMSHARDAARHALFAAVRDAGLPDPLSRR